MSIINIVKANTPMLDCWHPDFLNRCLAATPRPDQINFEQWAHTYIFDAALNRSTKRMNVTEAIRLFLPNPPDWFQTPLYPLYDNSYINHDQERASWFYGNYICRIGIKQRPETWWTFKDNVGRYKSSSTYAIGGLI